MQLKQWGLAFCVMLMCCGVWAQSTYIGTQQQKGKVEKTKQTIPDGACGSGMYPVRLTSYVTNPPFGWVEQVRDGEGNMSYAQKGYAVELIQRLLKKHDIYARPVGFLTDSEALSALSSTKADMYVGAYYEPKLRLAGHIYLTPSFVQNTISLIMLKNSDKVVSGFDDLIGLKGIMRADERFYEYVYPLLPKTTNITVVPDSKEAFTQLLMGQADYMIASPYSTEAEARRFKVNDRIKMSTLPLNGQGLFVVISGRSECRGLAQLLARELKAYIQDPAAVHADIMTYVNDWGENFRSAPSLLTELPKQKDTEKTEK